MTADCWLLLRPHARLSQLPTMYRRGIVLVATLLAVVVLGDDVQQPTRPSTALSVLPGSNSGMPVKMSDFCFFGIKPSASCRFKCSLIDKTSYCDEEKKMCLCTEPEEEEESEEIFNPPQEPVTSGQKTGAVPAPKPEESLAVPMHPVPTTGEPEEDKTGENKHHMVFYIFDLNKIFGTQKTPEETTTTAKAGTQTDVAPGDTTPEPVAPTGWSFQHFLAILIIFLLAILIFLELYAFCKKRNTQNHVENIFKTMPIPDKS